MLPAPTNWYVETTGDDSNDCQSLATACRTIAAAVVKSPNGAVILIGPGTYRERTTRPTAIHTLLQTDGVTIVDKIVTLRGTRSTDGVLTIISGSDTWEAGGAGNAIHVSGHSLVQLEDLILQNDGRIGGGVKGLVVVGSSAGNPTVSLRGVEIRNNTVIGVEIIGRAIVTFDDVTVRDNGGNGVYNAQGNLTIANSLFVGNHVGLFNARWASISDTEFTGNFGAGISNGVGGTMTIERTTISGTLPEADGSPSYGLYNGGTSLTVSNSTISANSEKGIQTVRSMSLVFSTVAENGGFGVNAGSGGFSPVVTLHLENSIIENNGSLDCSFERTPKLALELVGVNLSDSTCGPNGYGGYTRPATSGDTYLDQLTDNGGPTQTNALLPGSLAIDTATGDCPATDQRGIARPQGPGCDIGAYEFTRSSTVLPLVIATSETPSGGVPGVIPLYTDTPQAPALILPPTTTDIPGIVQLTLDKNANCRRGPGTVYSVLTSVPAGETVELTARNEENTWWFTVLPGNYPCWISMVAGKPNGNTNQLPVKQGPPTPIPTAEIIQCSNYADPSSCTSNGCAWDKQKNSCQ
ncbi:MAG: choice-of-anchor Q domain-containing protein [Anaerolineales bacterium]